MRTWLSIRFILITFRLRYPEADFLVLLYDVVFLSSNSILPPGIDSALLEFGGFQKQSYTCSM